MKELDLSLYLVTNSDQKRKEEYLKIVEDSILGGVTVVQIREKEKTGKEFYELAIELKKITEKYNVPLIINDRIDIALAVDADGVHIGQKDLPVGIVRKIIGENKILGVSTATIQTAIESAKNRADYISSGAIFPTQTKDTDCISISYLKKIVKSVEIPVVAIGGLNEDNIDSLFGTNVKGISIVSAIMDSENPKKSAEHLKKEFELI